MLVRLTNLVIIALLKSIIFLNTDIAVLLINIQYRDCIISKLRIYFNKTITKILN